MMNRTVRLPAMLAVIIGLASVFCLGILIGCGGGGGRGGLVQLVSNPSPSGNPWITIPAGDFIRGCADGDTQCSSDESPKSTIHLSQYKIQKYPVTNAEYESCVTARTCASQYEGNCYQWTGSGWQNKSASELGSEFRGANNPVVCVNWHQAKTYCEWIGGRLPTEAEWEKAARGPSPREVIYPWGDGAPTSALANYGRNVGHTTEVGSYPSGASHYGVMDMAGNVFEWVNDWYNSGYYSTSPSIDPPGPSSGSYRVLRGGSWFYGTRGLRVSFRGSSYPVDSGDDLGFRCAQD